MAATVWPTRAKANYNLCKAQEIIGFQPVLQQIILLLLDIILFRQTIVVQHLFVMP